MPRQREERGRSSNSKHREASPGKTVYEQRSPSPERGRSSKKSSRSVAGMDNLKHDNSKMLPIFRANALSPIPHEPGSTEERKHLMDENRRYRTQSSGGTPTGEVKGHKNTVMGHKKDCSAGQYFNSVGHTQHRDENKYYNSQASSFHGLEKKHLSAKSGHKEERYLKPSPSKGSHACYWNEDHPDYIKGSPSRFKKVQ